ncbi:hypothetical protein BpHYR1_029560 [Brachionus plicatilis]|uniref:Uncharacterized protein n=1 Tax=Brachionus plicatilis TaxID=10195 RepID=A0A3M7RB46_BRAPC|nr:hypothetical protein BpHYR1_029560 [Brachionus plicatilis]
MHWSQLKFTGLIFKKIQKDIKSKRNIRQTFIINYLISLSIIRNIKFFTPKLLNILDIFIFKIIYVKSGKFRIFYFCKFKIFYLNCIKFTSILRRIKWDTTSEVLTKNLDNSLRRIQIYRKTPDLQGEKWKNWLILIYLNHLTDQITTVLDFCPKSVFKVNKYYQFGISFINGYASIILYNFIPEKP